MQHQHSFFASLESLNESNHTAKFYIMNTSPNLNRWGVTAQALEEALPTLKGKPIGLGSDYKTEKHYSDAIDCGQFVSYQNFGSYATATAQIDDAKTWTMMQSSELGPISVVITCYLDTCSKCSANLRGIETPEKTHSCFVDDGTYSKVESFTFTRVDFVDVPAYPQAGVLEMSAAAFYSDRFTSLDQAVREMRAELRLPAGNSDSWITVSTGDNSKKTAEYTPKEAAALEAAIAKARIRNGFCFGYEEE